MSSMPRRTRAAYLLIAAAIFLTEVAIAAGWGYSVVITLTGGGEVAEEGRRASLSAMTNLMCRGRKRGLAGVIATQRLAKLAKNVAAEASNFLMGRTFLDIDMARAADLLGFPARDADLLRNLAPGDFFAMGPALSATPVLAHIDPTITEHLGKTPELRAAASVDADEAAKLLDLAGLAEVADHGPAIALKGTRALDAFLLDPAATDAAAIMDALKRISPNASTARDLARHLSLDAERTDRALNLLSAIAAVATMPKGDARIARLHARLRARLSDVAVVSL